MKATYLLIKSSVLSVTNLDEPKVPDYGDREMDASDSEITGEQLYKRRMDGYTIAMDVFLESFIKVDNPQMLWDMQNDDGYYLYDKEGLFPAPEGIEFEVKPEDWKKLCGYGREYCMEDDMCQCPEVKSEKLAVVSLIDAKEKEQSGEHGNEAKKEADLWQTVNPNKPKYAMSTNLTTEGMDVNWIDLWCEIENWYGDHTKRETAEQLLNRLQKKFKITTH